MISVPLSPITLRVRIIRPRSQKIGGLKATPYKKYRPIRRMIMSKILALILVLFLAVGCELWALSMSAFQLVSLSARLRLSAWLGVVGRVLAHLFHFFILFTFHSFMYKILRKPFTNLPNYQFQITKSPIPNQPIKQYPSFTSDNLH